MYWYNEPPYWQESNGKLTVFATGRTDFWRITHYGFIRDNGHFCYQQQQGDFEVSVQLTGAYRELYDQAGLMIRLDEQHWIKTGIEFVNGLQHVSAVVTRQFSDWSVVPLAVPPTSVWLKLLRKGDYVEVRYSLDGTTFSMLRLAYFPPAVPVQIGMMAAAPTGEGFQAVFESFLLTPLP